jgi:hypothetical protein
MSMTNKSHAREGRGAGNGGNENWYNSPLWKSINEQKPSKEPETKEILVNKETNTRSLYGYIY